MQVISEGSQAHTIATTHTLATLTDPGIYVVTLDLDALAQGDGLRIILSTRARAASPVGVVIEHEVWHDQHASTIWTSPPIVSPFEFIAQTRQLAGTGRTVPWSIVDLSG